MSTIQAQSTGEDSNSSDTAASDHGDLDHLDGMNGSLEQRHSFPSGFLGLQGIPGLLPGPSGMHGSDNFGKSTMFFYCDFIFDFVFILVV